MTDLQLALSHHQAGQYTQAQRIYEAILQATPNDPNALHLLGVLHNAQMQYETGIPYIRRAIELVPQMAEAHYNLGNALAKIEQRAEAIAAYDEATRLDPQHKNAWLNKGDAYRMLQKWAAAEDCYRRALLLDPNNYHLYVRLGSVLRSLRRLPESVAAYQQALDLAPESNDAHYNLANAFFEDGAFDQALHYYQLAAASPTTDPQVTGAILACMTTTCIWEHEVLRSGALSELRDKPLPPFLTLLLSESGAEQLHFARNYAKSVGLLEPTAAVQPPRSMENGRKLRIGYLSADFHQHATAYLIAELIKIHDRTKFEIIGISFGPDDNSPVRRRMIESLDQFLDIRDDDDETAAQRIEAADIDILVDLKGYTQHARVGILRRRPAPILVNYLGYPGTMGTPMIDYIIADSVVLPFTDQAHFDEKIVHLPNCYQVNDSTVDVDPTADTRAQHGLPAEAFVFCSLNGSQKITQEMFSVWMRVLAAVPHSVLWLFHDNDTAVRNLQNAASQHGIDPNRLVFAPKMAHSKHLARYRHADLFLDTSPCNAHTTASDALRAHLPLLTVRGSTFAGRVASSLLHAVGVPELVTDDLQAYEKAACQLANDPASLSKLRERIAEGVRTGPLFDTARFAQGIEAAFLHMHAAAGQPPRSFAVCADGTINEQ